MNFYMLAVQISRTSLFDRRVFSVKCYNMLLIIYGELNGNPPVNSPVVRYNIRLMNRYDRKHSKCNYQSHSSISVFASSPLRTSC